MKTLFPVCALLLMLFGCKKDDVAATHAPFVYTDSVADIDGNYYHTVTIGSQVWLAENLRTTRYQNGDTIYYLASSSTWSYYTQAACCDYDNDPAAAAIYGKLYNYRAATDSRNICPVGYHIPTYGEWQALIGYLQDSVSDKLREYGAKHWFPPNANARDQYGFAALPGGWRDGAGDFGKVRHVAHFWSSSHYIPSNSSYPEGWMMKLYSDIDPVTGTPLHEVTHDVYQTGCTIRCIKD